MSDDTGQECTVTDEVTVEGLRVDLARRRAALGRRLAECREVAELSQSGLGRVIGETRTSVSKVENGWRGRDRSWWERVDGLCGAGGGLVAAWEELDRATAEYLGAGVRYCAGSARRLDVTRWPPRPRRRGSGRRSGRGCRPRANDWRRSCFGS